MSTIIAHTAVVDPRAELDDEVRIGHQCVIGANVQLGRGTRLENTVTNDDLGRRAFVRQILWFCADDHVGEQMIVAADARVATYSDIVFQARATSNLHVGADHAVVADADFVIQFRSGINDSRVRYDGGHRVRLSNSGYYWTFKRLVARIENL